MIVERLKKNNKVISSKLILVEEKDVKDGYKIKIPEGITEIGSNAFSKIKYAKALYIKMPDSVTKIEEDAFRCIDDQKLEIQKIKFSENLKEIGNGAFADCIFHHTVILPNDLHTIPYQCFASCDFQNGIGLPGKLEKIEERAFTYANLDEIFIPDSVTSIGEHAFSHSGLKKVKLPNTLKEIESKSFAYTPLKKVKLPETLEKIGNGAFMETKLEEVICPKNLKQIGKSAFSGSTKLNHVDLGNVSSIGDYAFQLCSIEDLKLNENCKEIKNMAFANNKLKSLSMTDTQYEYITSDYQAVFINNPELENIEIRHIEQLPVDKARQLQFKKEI